MRKKLCIIMAGLLIMAAAAGCAGKKDNNKSSSSQTSSASSTESTESKASTADSKTESTESSAENSDTSSTEQSSENESPFIDITYTSFDLEGLQKGTSAKLPACFIITSKSELDDFLTKNDSEYILNRGMLSAANGTESNQNFLTYSSANYTEEMFKNSDIMLVMAAFNKDEEADLGDISIDGDKVNIELWGAEPGDNEQKFILYAITYKKGTIKDKEPAFRYTGEMNTSGEEEGGEEEPVTSSDDGEEIVINLEGGEEGVTVVDESEEEMIITSEEQ